MLSGHYSLEFSVSDGLAKGNVNSRWPKQTDSSPKRAVLSAKMACEKWRIDRFQAGSKQLFPRNSLSRL